MAVKSADSMARDSRELRVGEGTRRGDQLLELASRGLTDKEIAAELGITSATVESHWKRLRTRTSHSSRSAIVADWLRTQLDAQATAHAVAMESLNSHLRKQTEMYERAHAVFEFAEYLEYGMSAAATLVYVTDLLEPFTFRFVSQSCEVFGWTREDFLEGRFKVFEAVHPEDVGVIWQARQKYAEQGARSAAYFYRVKTPRLGLRWFFDRQTITAASIHESGLSIGMATDVMPLVESGLLKPRASSWVLETPKMPEIR